MAPRSVKVPNGVCASFPASVEWTFRASGGSMPRRKEMSPNGNIPTRRIWDRVVVSGLRCS